MVPKRRREDLGYCKRMEGVTSLEVAVLPVDEAVSEERWMEGGVVGSKPPWPMLQRLVRGKGKEREVVRDSGLQRCSRVGEGQRAEERRKGEGVGAVEKKRGVPRN